jgi:small-conductance mechanosensitive channel
LIGIASVGWLFLGLLRVASDALDERYVLQQTDNLSARRIHTRFQLLYRIAGVLVAVVTFTAMVMTSPEMRHVGAGILASAGIAGIVLGIAARPFVETLLAGLQIAFTQPTNIDDVVIVEGEWGRIEEITTTYVVVRIWDKRRLILPIAYFIQRPFQNWTRVTADLLGIVTVEVDYRTPVAPVREAIGAMLADCALWNHEFRNLQVVEAGERSIRLRVLLSAPNADEAWELRCHVREWLIGWLQEHHPEALPRLRVEGSGDAVGSGDALAEARRRN